MSSCTVHLSTFVFIYSTFVFIYSTFNANFIQYMYRATDICLQVPLKYLKVPSSTLKYSTFVFISEWHGGSHKQRVWLVVCGWLFCGCLPVTRLVCMCMYVCIYVHALVVCGCLGVICLVCMCMYVCMYVCLYVIELSTCTGACARSKGRAGRAG